MDRTDWEMVAIEANLGNVPPAAVRDVLDEAERLLSRPATPKHEIIPAARALAALVRYYSRPTRSG